MTEILLTLAGGIVSSLVIDILLPDGDMKKYSKFIVQIIIAMIILSPIISKVMSFKGKEFDYKNFAIDEKYIYAVESQQQNVVKDGLVEYLKMNGITCDVEIKYNGKEIEKVELKNVEMAKRTMAKELTATLLGIEKEKVETNG
ncbi:MAG: stage III sporulation protein AF [Clostridia bacterium]